MGHYPKFADLLNEYLLSEQRSAAWLARRLAVHHGTVARWRNGESRPDKPETIIRVADFLAVYDQSKRQELLVAAGYGYQYQPPASAPPSSSAGQLAEVVEAPVAPSSSVPRSSANRLQLKPALEHLVGVEEHLKQLEQLLLSPSRPWVVSIEGIGGIGKTSLAKALVHRIVGKEVVAGAKKFEGFCWVNVRKRPPPPPPPEGRENPPPPVLGEGPGVGAVLVLDELMRQLLATEFPLLPTEDTPRMRGALSSENALARLQNHLTEHPHLIVIDNLEALTDTLRLLPTLRYLAAPSKFLLTSRESLFAELDVYPFRVPLLSESNAIRLLRQEAKARNLPHLIECDDDLYDILKSIYDTVGGHPLALRLVVGQTYIHHLSVVLGDLATARGQEVVNLYSHIYRRAWDNLDEITRRLFLLMRFVTPQGGSLDYIKHLSQLESHILHQSLHLLVSLNLIDVQRDLSAWRYTIHPLTRTFLQQQVTQWLSSSSSTAPDTDIQRLFDAYMVRSAEYLLTQAQQAASSLPVEVREQALHTLSLAYEGNSSLPAAIWPVVRDLLLTIAPKMEQAGHREEWMIYLERGIEQSLKLADIETEAELHVHLGMLHRHQAQYQAQYNEARRHFSSSARLFEQLGKPDHQARALNRLAALARQQHHFDEAKQLAHAALDLVSEKKEKKEEIAYSYSVLGTIASDQRDWHLARDLFSKSLALWEKTSNQRLIGWGLINQGTALRALQRYSETIACYERAISLFEAIEDRHYQAVARMNLGNVYLKLEHPLDALDYYVLAEAEFNKTKATIFIAKVNFNKGIAYEKLQKWQEAKEMYLTSIAHWQRIGPVSAVVHVMTQLGTVYLNLKQSDKAIATFQDAQSKLTKIKNKTIHDHLLTKLTTYLDQARPES